MKKLLRIITLTGFVLIVQTACKNQVKEEIVEPENNTAIQQEPDKITREVYTDESGEQLEVGFNETKNTVVVHLDGKSYELKKSDELPDFTAGDANYQYSDVRGEITFLKKDYNMVLFHHKKKKSSSSNTKMASY
ncbi:MULTISPECIES: hypothetical protein [Chryseobacterium]|uniref:C-type lysozyme inhibitor domain-containing protein n=1 Tax=Candidatus Chryseobacterium massiliense TaxID=204089 RepID=A0A3D9B4Q0_9FLAO|nr:MULTISPECIES: hypothetical protein [Chryseobacterium]REC48661.1 hypothetical protein DRF68_11420 [Candidatus Chryseobacterium massiliae]HCR76766.1 hypothetical protein [Chryseobacterium sp.]